MNYRIKKDEIIKSDNYICHKCKEFKITSESFAEGKVICKDCFENINKPIDIVSELKRGDK